FIIGIILIAIWKIIGFKKPIAGLSFRNFNIKPYLIILACMIPLVAFAATQSDFLRMYPKYKSITFIAPFTAELWKYRLLYELSYGSDFVTIELFFRGFLVLAFCKLFGKDAILPMAAFYCTIHFGKPLLECISSYFGGIILGVIVYRTQTIWGGLIAHLGIAWMMEAGGYFGNQLFK
ncbi:MAG: CPBP family intramembrane metalloprotease, partial [Chitinophagaceae bacterium]|nr:CPBP family intramembrane metalloprotease [Chitinophagaceae bacterium]